MFEDSKYSFKMIRISKDPAYGRQNISRRMQIIALIPQQGGPRIPKNPNFLKSGKKSSKTQNLKNVKKYAKISETPLNQRSLIHREACYHVTQKPEFFEKCKNSFKTKQKLKNVQKYAKVSDTPIDQRSLIHWEVWFPSYFER